MKCTNRFLMVAGILMLTACACIPRIQAAETVARDGGVPVCWPGIGCGKVQPVPALQDGPGPACLPDPLGCGDAQSTRVRRDGPGPMCFPGIGCGDAQSTRVLRGGPRPVPCFPGINCGENRIGVTLKDGGDPVPCIPGINCD